ncbi:FGGY-family carbohydrate kinase [Rhodococcus globerulus]|uniref:FGGY family carbohydrate kinase n=1 Tax=Rhodococcus globerulus TaxID=33008 RepID=A0ABU4BPH4_RHOGO|nr:FGGY family carbohydrate kinase [Rhodococcus globerulus]MDV6266101.1 FGGY family carbohydrate kinase [Rhodococcus globerulus]
MDLLVGMDMGTASSKGVLVTPDGVVLATEQIDHQISMPRPGWAEVDAEKMWWSEVCSISKRLVAQVPRSANVAGVCVSGVGPALVLCDSELRPLRPAILYGIDSRASAEVASLTELFGEKAILDCGGKLLSSQAVGPKIEWVRIHEPEIFAAATRWYGSNSYIAAKLTGEYIQDHHTASQCDPLYSVRDFSWKSDWLDRVLGHLECPRLVWPSDVVGLVHADASEQTGLPVGTPVVAGTVDAFSEGFSVGARHPGDLMLMYGSTMFLVQILEKFQSNPALWTTAGVQKDTLALAAGTSTAGSLIEWLHKLTGDVPFEQLLAEAAAVPAGAEGLLILPYFAGERTPVFDPKARGVVAGLSLRHGRGHLFRATYEGIAFGIRQILEMFGDTDEPVRRTIAVGGGVKSRVWTQAISDITGHTQLVPTQTIGASYGDALLAAIGTGLVAPDTDWTTLSHEVVPNAANRAMYEDLYQTWLTLYPSTREQIHALAQFG